MPDLMHVALGGSGHRVESHRLEDYLAYFRSVRQRFQAAVATDQPLAYPLPVTPEPVSHCGVCRWNGYCAGLRRDADHLSLVAGMRSDVARRLSDAGIATFGALATLESPLPIVAKVSDVVLANLHQQARLQYQSRVLSTPLYEFLPVEPNRGLGGLPAPSGGDLFFDMEADPFAEDDGLEYLFGVWDRDGFHTWWAHDHAAEKVAFEGFIDFVMDRWRSDPTMHVYHYAAYERGRIGMLATRHATREVKVDRIRTTVGGATLPIACAHRPPRSRMLRSVASSATSSSGIAARRTSSGGPSMNGVGYRTSSSLMTRIRSASSNGWPRWIVHGNPCDIGIGSTPSSHTD
jgi:uncharacterized protein